MTVPPHTPPNQSSPPSVGVDTPAGEALPSLEERQVDKFDRKRAIEEIWHLGKIRDNLLQQMKRCESRDQRESQHYLRLFHVSVGIETRRASLREQLRFARFPELLELSHMDRMNLCDLSMKLKSFIALCKKDGLDPKEQWRMLASKAALNQKQSKSPAR
jgi:hypothetical protein